MGKYMMDIDCKAYQRCEIPIDFNLNTNSILSMYLGKLGYKYETEPFGKAIVKLHKNLIDKENWTTLEGLTLDERRERIAQNTYNYLNEIEKMIDVTCIHRTFDFDTYFKSDKPTKKQMILSALHDGILLLAKHWDWAIEPLQNAYNKVIEQKLENRFTSKSLKVKSSIDRKYKGSIYVEHDIDFYRISGLIADKNDSELKRTIFADLSPSGYPYDVQPIFKGKTQWTKTEKGQEFSLIDEKGNLIGKMMVDDE